MGRRITKAICQRIALCKRGKNGLTTLFKSGSSHATLTKADMAKGELLSVVAMPQWIDDDGDEFDSAEVVRDFAHSIIEQGAEVDIEHDGKVLTPEQARITEVFIIQDSDERFKEWPTYDGDSVDAAGGVAVQFQIDDPDLRAAFGPDGDWDGVSLFGPAAVEEIKTKAASKRVAARMGRQGEQNMDEKELKAALAEFKTSMVELVKSAVAEALPKVETTEGGETNTEGEAEQRPVFSGDVNDDAALEAYEGELRAFDMRAQIASGDMTADGLAALRKSRSETLPTSDELKAEGLEIGDGASDEEKRLTNLLFKARQGTKAPARSGNEESTEDQLAKAATDEGLAIAGIFNESHGSGAATMRVISK